ncbi:MAG TPA: hypothetical protein VHR97_11200 [Candidatus Baltobacteraceae bacterium]|jgi:hypothetical protein|nr:hypothetical protein [Candidatus Baltobacteraceae bacterium]
MRIETLVERIELVGKQAISLYDRAEVLERVAGELRTEAAGASHEVMLLRKDLNHQLTRVRTRKRVKAAFSEIAAARRAS